MIGRIAVCAWLLLSHSALSEQCLVGAGVLQPQYNEQLVAHLTGNATFWQKPFSYVRPTEEDQVFLDPLASGNVALNTDKLLAKEASDRLMALAFQNTGRAPTSGHLFTIQPDDYRDFYRDSIAEYDRLLREEAEAEKYRDEKVAERQEFNLSRSSVEDFYNNRRFLSMLVEGLSFGPAVVRAREDNIKENETTADIIDAWWNQRYPFTDSAILSAPGLEAMWRTQREVDREAQMISVREYESALQERVVNARAQQDALKQNFNRTINTIAAAAGVCSLPCFVGNTAAASGATIWANRGDLLAEVATDRSKWVLRDPKLTSAIVSALTKVPSNGSLGLFLTLKVESQPGETMLRVNGKAQFEASETSSFELTQRLSLTTAALEDANRRAVGGSMPIELTVDDELAETLALAFEEHAMGKMPVKYEVTAGPVLDQPKWLENSTWDRDDPTNYELAPVCAD